MQEARLLSEHRRVANELNQRVAQQTAELAAANQDLSKEVAARKRVEEVLAQSEARLADGERDQQLTIDTIPVFVATYQPDGTRSFVNRTWQEYMGLTLEEATGTGAKTFPHFHPADAELNDKAWRASLKNGKPLSIEVRVRRADGQYRWHISRRVPLRDENGDIVKWYSVGIDIEDQKVAEDALRQSQARLAETERELRLTLDSIPTMTWRGAPNGDVQYLNKPWFDYTGTTPEQVRGSRWQSCVHPDDLAGLLDIGRAYVASEKTIDAEARLRRFDGEYRWFLFRPAPARDETGKVVGWYGTITDIEDRKRANEVLRREVTERARAEQLARIEETRFRRFFDLPLIGMAVTSPERRFLEVNEKLCQILGYPREELIGRDWASITHPDDVSSNLSLLDESMGGVTESYSMDKRYIHRDGQIVYASISVCCVRRTDGAADHFVLTVQDVTARHQVQEQLERTEAHLRHGQQIAQLASYEVYPPALGDGRWSEELYNMIGLDPGSPVPQMAEYIERFVHPDDRSHMREAVLRRVNADHRFTMEYRIVRPDGTLRYLQSITDPVKDESGRIVKLVGTLLDTTERKLATERLETQTALLDHLFQSVAEATVLLDLDDRVLRVNSEFTRMFGHTAERARGLSINDLIVPAERMDEAALLSSDLARGQVCNAESVRRHQDGSRLQVSILGAPIMSGGRQIASYAIYRDITERKRVEEAQARRARHVALRADVHAAFSRAGEPLQEVLRRGAEAIVHNLHGALARIWTLDQDMGVLELRASAGLYTHLDGPHSRIPFGHLIIGKIAEDRAPHLTNDVRNDPGISDRDWAQKEGIVGFVGAPLLIEGRVAGVVAMFAHHPLESDTVEAFEAIADTIAQGIGRRQADEALRESEQRFRDYAESASDWLWETGPDHRFTWFSLRATRVHRPDSRIGRARWEIAADVDDEPEKWRVHIATLDAHEPFRGFTYRTVQGDGSIAYLAASGKPVFDAQGDFQGYRGVASDVTAAVRADQTEKALHQAQAELAHVARVTTLGELAASIAHEINQPLAAIVADAYAGLNWLDASGVKLDNVREALAGIVSDGDRAAQVVTRIRALLSRSPIERAPCDLTRVVSDAVLLVGAELRRHGIVLEMLLGAELPQVMGDRVQLQQVVLNLLVNAIEAMREVPRERRRLIARSLVEQRDDGPLAVVAVEDAGVGFGGSQTRLFDAFYTTKPGGLGMGLSISRSIIERHGGRLWATANQEHGATFHFALPGMK
jgi:PAS domain S-box-containing protein